MSTVISEREPQEYLKSLTVLYVEDEEDSREQCSEFLSRLVGVLVTAHNGVEGLDAWRQHKPDIIITDIRMPVMGGLAMLQEIRRIDRAVPIIILSAFEEPEYLKRSIDLGVYGYVNKPVNVSRFAELLLRCAQGLLVETKLVQAHTALRKQHEFTQATLDGQSAHICVLNAQGVIVNTNRAWDTFAVANNAAPGSCCVGSNYLDVLNVCLVAANEDRAGIEEFHACIKAVLIGTMPQFVMEYDCSSPDKVLWFVCRANQFVVDDESYVVISHEDITARKQIEAALSENQKQLQSLNDQLENRIAKEVGKNRAKDSLLLHQDKMSSIGQLAAGVAHEINNPMGYIISNLASLSKYVDKLTTYLDANANYFAESDSGTREYLAQERNKYKIDRIRQDLPELICESREGAERVRKIVQDLRNFSRLDNSTDEFSDINKGLESTMTIAWNELKYKATVNREYGQLPLVWCNMGQLNQVFLNILVNAAHAIEGQGEIRIATWAAAESVKIAISDNGCGIAPEDVKRIFDPFFTTKEVGKGTGLGLAIAYDIVVNKHRGIIDVTSEIDTGTTFTITLPVKRE